MTVENFDQGFSYGCWFDCKDYNFALPHIEIGIDTIFMSISYSAPSMEAFENVLPIFEKHGFVAFDPQLDKIVTSKDLAEANKKLRLTFGTVKKVITGEKE